MLAQARQAGIEHLLIPAIQRSGWQNLWNLCLTDDQLYPAIGLHPVMLEQHVQGDLKALETFIQLQPPVAIGEIGLDYAIKTLDKKKQEALLDAQLDIAARHQLPVILHIRKAHEPVLRLLKSHQLCGGICHAFNGSEQQAGRYIEMGFGFGFGGMLTYPNARHLHALARHLPLETIVLETDAPDMSGIHHRYQRNSPAYLPEVVQMLGELRGIAPDQIAETTTRNAFRILGIESQI